MLINKVYMRLNMNKLIAITTIILNLYPQGAIAMDTKNIIDIHCHTAGVGFGNSGCFISKNLQKSWKYKVYLRAFGVTEKEIREQGDRLVIKRLSEKVSESRYVSAAVVLAMDGVVGADGELDREKTEMYIPNEFVSREVRQYGNLLFGASINPYRRDALERLEKAATDGAVLVKWLPSIQNIDPADERLIPFYLKMKELGLPLLTHTGLEDSFTRSEDELSDPERLRLPLSLGVTVIAAHAACTGRSHGELNYDRLLRLCREFPNLYADISALTQMNRLNHLSKVLTQPELRGRLVYGSDMPLINTAIVSPYAFLFRIKPGRILAISRMRNPWDRDISLKKELGASPELFTAAASLLKIQKALPSVYTGAFNRNTDYSCLLAQELL
jgi:uncharacterized protein